MAKIAAFFQVTSDYLIGIDDMPDHATTDLCKETGLSFEAIQVLKRGTISTKCMSNQALCSSEILMNIFADILLSSTNDDFKTFLYSLKTACIYSRNIDDQPIDEIGNLINHFTLDLGEGSKHVPLDVLRDVYIAKAQRHASKLIEALGNSAEFADRFDKRVGDIQEVMSMSIIQSLE